MQKERNFHIGMRIIKSAIAVLICFLIYILRGFHGIPFYSAIAALQCIQQYQSNTKKTAVSRMVGTMIGAFYGLIIILIQKYLLLPYAFPYILYGLIVSLCIVAVLKTAVLLRHKSVAYFSCVVFLCITMVHIGDSNPWLFVLNRVVDTLLGVLIGIGTNAAQLPRRKKTDILYITPLDDILLTRDTSMSDYSRIELNRMLDEGLALSVITTRTTATFLEGAGDLRLKLPLILMNGAVLYDPVTRTYPAKKELSYCDAVQIAGIVRECGIGVYQNAIIDESVLIFCEGTHCPASMELYQKLRRSPYRNYIQRTLPEGVPVVYLMALDQTEVIESAVAKLIEAGADSQCRILHYETAEYPGHSYLKIYHKDASMPGMLEELMRLTGFEKTAIIGHTAECDDRQAKPADSDSFVRKLKQAFEPVSFSVHKK